MSETPQGNGPVDLGTPAALKQGYGEVFDFVRRSEGGLTHSLQAPENSALRSVFDRTEMAFNDGNRNRGWQTLEGLLIETSNDDTPVKSLWTDDFRDLSMKLHAVEQGDAPGWDMEQVSDWLGNHGSSQVKDQLDAANLLNDGPEKSDQLQRVLNRVEMAMGSLAFNPDTGDDMKVALREVQHAVYMERLMSDESFGGNTTPERAQPDEGLRNALDHVGGSAVAATVESTPVEIDPIEQRLDMIQLGNTVEENTRAQRDLKSLGEEEFSGVDDTKAEQFRAYVVKTIEAIVRQKELYVQTGELGENDTYAGNLNTLGLPYEVHTHLARRLNQSRDDGRGFTAADVAGYADGLIGLSLRDVCHRLGIDTSAVQGFEGTFSDKGVTMDEFLDRKNRQ